VRIKWHPRSVSLKGGYSWRRRTNPDQNYRVDAQDFTFAANYVPSFLPKLSVDASFTYEKILDKKDIFNLDFGTFAFQKAIFDSSAYIYAGGITYEGIYKGLGARIYGSYAKTRRNRSVIWIRCSLFYRTKCLIPAVTWRGLTCTIM
jgi:hypothetical protein